jgi:anti-sigma factor RsiW
MNQDPLETRLRELLWRRETTDAERDELRSWLAEHPERRADWDDEEQLSALLHQLPAAPVSSNFTLRVVQSAEREVAAQARTSSIRWNRSLRWLLPKLALVAIVISLVFVTFRTYETAQRREMARSLVAVSQVETMPSPKMLEDFEAIRRLGRTPPVDKELLALMQ